MWAVASVHMEVTAFKESGTQGQGDSLINKVFALGVLGPKFKAQNPRQKASHVGACFYPQHCRNGDGDSWDSIQPPS